MALMNRFRNPLLRGQYEAMIKDYHGKNPYLFTPEGKPHRGTALGLAFWNGFEGVVMGAGFSNSERSSPAYACWRAGQDCARLRVDF
jgi:hypothetical protein